MPIETCSLLSLTAEQIKEAAPFVDDMFRPPVNRAMRVLDRSFFQKRVPLAAARVLDNRKIANCRKDLEKSKDLLRLERMPTIRPDPEGGSGPNGRKCLLLQPGVKRNSMRKASNLLQHRDVNNFIRFFDLEHQATRACRRKSYQYLRL